jgi:hypothetical protein
MNARIYLLIVLVSLASIGCAVTPNPQDFHECLKHHSNSRAASECHIPHHGEQ